MRGPSAKDLFKVLNARYAEGGEVDIAEQMTVGTPPSDKSTFNIGEKLTEYGISPADVAAFLGRAGSAASLAMQPREAKAMTMDEFLASRQAALDFEGAAPNEASTARTVLQAVKSRNPAQGAQAAQEMMRMYSGFGDPIKGRFDVAKADPKADMGRALYASTSPEVASQSAMDRLKSKLIQPTGMAVYPLDIPKQSILFMEETYPAELAMKLKKFANKTSVPEGPTATGEELYQGIRTLPKEKQGEAVRLLGFRGAQFLPGGKPLSTDNFAIFDTDGTVSAITGKQFKEGGEVTDDEFIQEMMTGTPPSDRTPQRGLVPREIREAVDVPLDFLNLGIRGMAGAVAGPAYGLYQGITSEKFGTPEGVQEASSEAGKMMQRITGVPKTETAKKTLEFLEGVAQEAKIPPMPQFLTTPAPGPGSASALMRSYELAETAPAGSVKLPGKEGKPVATPQMDAMGLYSPTEQVVMNLPQEKGTAQQMLAQISKAPGSRAVELRATGLEEYLKGKGNAPVTRQEIQDFLKSNPVQVNEVVLGKGMVLSPEAKRRMAEAENRMIEIDNQLAPYFENSQRQDIDPVSTFYRLRGSLGRKAAAGDAEAMAEIDALNLPPDIKQLVLDFGEQKKEYGKYSKQARKMVKPQFDNYNIPGGENAREIYLTLPGPTKAGVLPPSVDAQGNVIRSANAPSPLYMAPPLHRVSPEADTNRLAHIFLDDRMDAEGKKVLFVQELQSDWGKEGREKGFISDVLPRLQKELSSRVEESKRLWSQNQNDPRLPELDREISNLRNQIDQASGAVDSDLFPSQKKGAVPTAPFVTSTEDWLNLALKRVIKEAVDTGADNVAFIKGAQAADKYKLRTVVDQITADRGITSGDDLYVSITPKNSLSPYAFYVGPDGVIKEPISPDARSKFLGEPLSSVIGKEAAEKLMSTKVGNSQILKEEGLSFGGEGMKGFYDNILPKTAEKLLKRLGGGKVEPIEVYKNAPSRIPFEADAFLDWMKENYSGVDRADAARAWSMGMDNNQFVKEFYEETKVDQYLGFKITPEMREMVKTQGLPKFAAGGEVTQFIKAHA
jgi:hypothetical protein